MPPDRRSILFVGRAEPRKGLTHLIDAYAILRERHDDLQLVIVGPSRNRGREQREQVRAAGWSDVIYVGPVADEDLPAYYQAAAAFCSPATGGEAFGLVLTEAMAAGAPIVAGDNPGYRDVVRDGTDGLLVAPKDPGAIADAIARILDDPALRKRLSESGRRRAEAFRVETVGPRILAMYDRAVQERRSVRVTPQPAPS